MSRVRGLGAALIAALSLIAILPAGAACAADLVVTLRNAAGQPVTDAVVTVYPAGGAGGDKIKFDWRYRVAQQNIQFDPFVLIVPVGATVDFPNLDTVRHHVYSFSPTHPFSLKLYSRDETKSVQFDKAGFVALGCNIHDKMVGFIKVVDTPYAAKTGASGEVTLHGLPAGGATLRIWHPYLKAPNGEMVRAITLGTAARHETATLEVRASPPR